MADRIVTDTNGREWTCVPAASTSTDTLGRDVILSCTTTSVDKPVSVTVGWQWEKMSSNGLGRMLSQASPVPKE